MQPRFSELSDLPYVTAVVSSGTGCQCTYLQTTKGQSISIRYTHTQMKFVLSEVQIQTFYMIFRYIGTRTSHVIFGIHCLQGSSCSFILLVLLLNHDCHSLVDKKKQEILNLLVNFLQEISLIQYRNSEKKSRNSFKNRKISISV